MSSIFCPAFLFKELHYYQTLLWERLGRYLYML
nr:MAG TPA: hypothetical protein [Caudoviricetes sp.]